MLSDSDQEEFSWKKTRVGHWKYGGSLKSGWKAPWLRLSVFVFNHL